MARKPKRPRADKDVEAHDSTESDVSIDKDNTKHKQTKSVTHKKIAGGHVTTTVITNESEREALSSSKKGAGGGADDGGLLGCFGKGKGRIGTGFWYNHPISIAFVVTAVLITVLSIISASILLATTLKLHPGATSRPDIHRICQNIPGHEHFTDNQKLGTYSYRLNRELFTLCPKIPGSVYYDRDPSPCSRACGKFHTLYEPMLLVGIATSLIHLVGGLITVILLLIPFTTIMGLICGIVVHGIATVGVCVTSSMAEGEHKLREGFVQVMKVALDKHVVDLVNNNHLSEIGADQNYVVGYQTAIQFLKFAIILELVICLLTTAILIAALVFYCFRINNRVY